MRKSIVVWFGVIAAAGLAVAFVLLRAPQVETANTTKPTTSAVPEERVQVPQPSSTPRHETDQRTKVTEPANSVDLDAVEQANRLVARAEKGDREAQVGLFHILGDCEEAYRLYFVRGKKTRTLDEALMWASTRPMVDSDDVRATHEHCHRLMEERPQHLRTANEWLALATAAGQPVAAAHTANQLLTEATLAGMGENKNLDTAKLRKEAAQNLRIAAASGAPEALWMTAQAQAFIKDSREEAQRESLAIKLVACERGFDCSSKARWYRLACLQDQLCLPGQDGTALLKRFAGATLPEVETRAREIQDMLLAGRGAELIHGPGVDFEN